MQTSVKELHLKRIKMWDASISNHKKYIDSQTGIFSDIFVEERACPVCSSHNELEMFYKEGGRYVQCKQCTMVYLNPVFKDTYLNEYYKNNHAVQSEVVESDESFYAKLYNQGLNSVLKINPSADSILDIGCSSGAFLNIAKKRGLETHGIELNNAESEAAKKKGHKVYSRPLEELEFDRKFNIVSMWDVFEHLKNGAFYLNFIKNMLTDKGLIFLQIPSSDSLAARILRESCNMFDGLEHVNLYGVKTINQLAKACGLRILSLETVISEIGVINNYLGFQDPYLGTIDNKKNIFNLIDEHDLHKNLLGYKMQLVLGL